MTNRTITRAERNELLAELDQINAQRRQLEESWQAALDAEDMEAIDMYQALVHKARARGAATILDILGY